MVGFSDAGNPEKENHQPAASHGPKLDHIKLYGVPVHLAINRSTLMVIVGIDYIDRCKSNYHRITSSGAQHYNVSNADGYIILFVMSDLISIDLVS